MGDVFVQVRHSRNRITDRGKRVKKMADEIASMKPYYHPNV